MRRVFGALETARPLGLVNPATLEFPELMKHIGVVKQGTDAAGVLRPDQVPDMLSGIEITQFLEEGAERDSIGYPVAIINFLRIGGVEGDPESHEAQVVLALVVAGAAQPAHGAVQAHAETYVGLVEVGVGLIPGWGGCKEMLNRWATLGRLPKGPMPFVAKAFELISTATVAKSAAEAKEMLFLRPTDGITMNRYRLLADAKAKADADKKAGEDRLSAVETRLSELAERPPKPMPRRVEKLMGWTG